MYMCGLCGRTIGCSRHAALASVRGLLNIKSLNESTHENITALPLQRTGWKGMPTPHPYSVTNSNLTGTLVLLTSPQPSSANHTPPTQPLSAIIHSIISESATAFLRHAFGCFYDAFSQIDLANRPFIPTLVFHETLLSFPSAFSTPRG